MTIKVKKSGAFANATTVKRRSGGAWVNVATIKRRSAGAWVTVYAFEHSVSTPNVNANLSNGSHTSGCTATVTGGIGPFTYAWTETGGATISNTTSQTVTINTSGSDTLFEGTVTCNVTDTGNGNLVRSDTANYSIQHGTPV